MPTLSPVRIAPSHLWSLAVLASGVPSLIATQFGGDRLLVGSLQVALLVVASVVVRLHPRWGRLRQPLVVATILAAFFHLGLNVLLAPGAPIELFTGGPLWRRLLLWQGLSGTVSLLLLWYLRTTGVAELFLRRGDIDAPARPIRLLGMRRTRPWRRVGTTVALVLTGGTAAFLVAGGAFAGNGGWGLLAAVPAALALAAVNAANEEFQTRNSVIAVLEPLGGGTQAAAVSAFLFGSWHFAGVPGGVLGAAMAGFAGYLWARSMVETRGMLLAWGVHALQDVVIFTALLS